MAVQIETLTSLLKRNDYAGVLRTSLTVAEQDKTDDLKLLELIARIKTDQTSPMVQHYLSESLGWTYEEPDKLLAERAFIHLLHNEGSPAIRLYNQLGEENFTAVDYNRLGNAYLINSDFDQALRCYDRAIELEPKEPSHRNNKGGALARLQRFDVALEVYEECLELDPNHTTAKEAKQRLLIKLNQSVEVLDDL